MATRLGRVLASFTLLLCLSAHVYAAEDLLKLVQSKEACVELERKFDRNLTECMFAEAKAIDEVLISWDAFPEKVKVDCLEMAKSSKPVGWLWLKTCTQKHDEIFKEDDDE